MAWFGRASTMVVAISGGAPALGIAPAVAVEVGLHPPSGELA
jgi:hypothetical protein